MGAMTTGAHAQFGAAPPGGPGGGPGGMAPPADYRNLTPEQRQQLMEEVGNFMRERTMRLMLTNAGVSDKTVQDTIVTFANEQNAATQAVRDQNRMLRDVLNDQTAPPAQIGGALKEFRDAADAETARRKTALEALDAKISYSKNPRLAAVLTTLGLVGDEMAIAEGGGGGFGGRGGGMGGMMGGFGGPGGGFGGPGGGPGGMGGRGFGGPGGGQGGPGGGQGGRGGRGGGGGGGGRDGGGGRGGQPRQPGLPVQPGAVR